MTRVLVTDFSSYKSVVLARFIRALYPHVDLLTCDTRAFTRQIRSRHSPRHHVLHARGAGDPAYAGELADLCAREEVDLLIPVNSRELGPLLQRRERFGRALAYWGAAADYEMLHDKARLHGLLADAGVHMPAHYPSIDEAVLPFVAKPPAAASAKGVVYCFTEDDRAGLKARLGAAADSMIFQEYVAGEGVGFSGYFEDGKIRVAHGHRRLAEFPVTGGSSVYRESLTSESEIAPLRAAVEKILARAPWSGFAMFEFKRTSAGEHVLIECNPRVWGSIHQGLAAGVNYLAPLLGGADLPAASRNTYLSPLLYLAFAQYLARGRTREIARWLRGAPRNRADISPFTDPMGWAALIGRGT